MADIFKAKDEAELAREILDDIQATDTDTMSRIKHARSKLANAITALDKVILDRVHLPVNIDKDYNYR